MNCNDCFDGIIILQRCHIQYEPIKNESETLCSLESCVYETYISHRKFCKNENHCSIFRGCAHYSRSHPCKCKSKNVIIICWLPRDECNSKLSVGWVCNTFCICWRKKKVFYVWLFNLWTMSVWIFFLFHIGALRWISLKHNIVICRNQLHKFYNFCCAPSLLSLALCRCRSSLIIC